MSSAEKGLTEGLSSTDISVRGDDGSDIEAPSSSRAPNEHTSVPPTLVDPNGVVLNERAIDVDPADDSKTYQNEAFLVESPDAPSHGSSSEQAMSGYGDSTSAEHEVGTLPGMVVILPRMVGILSGMMGMLSGIGE